MTEILYAYPVIPEQGIFLQLVNLTLAILAVIAAVLAIKLATLLKGGQLEQSWNWLAGAAVTFALFELYGALKQLRLVYISGLDEFLGFVMVVILLFAFYKTRKNLLERV